jgi:hypothetical protein
MGGSASEEIEAPLDEVWEVVADVLTAPEWQGGLVAMSALEHDEEGRPTLVETETTSRSATSRRRSASATTRPLGCRGHRRRAT